jgi:hypothetical protein
MLAMMGTRWPTRCKLTGNVRGLRYRCKWQACLHVVDSEHNVSLVRQRQDMQEAVGRAAHGIPGQNVTIFFCGKEFVAHIMVVAFSNACRVMMSRARAPRCSMRKRRATAFLQSYEEINIL